MKNRFPFSTLRFWKFILPSNSFTQNPFYYPTPLYKNFNSSPNSVKILQISLSTHQFLETHLSSPYNFLPPSIFLHKTFILSSNPATTGKHGRRIPIMAQHRRQFLANYSLHSRRTSEHAWTCDSLR